jgi:hypothetical protein
VHFGAKGDVGEGGGTYTSMRPMRVALHCGRTSLVMRGPSAWAERRGRVISVGFIVHLSAAAPKDMGEPGET